MRTPSGKKSERILFDLEHYTKDELLQVIKSCQKELSLRDKSYVTPLKTAMIIFCETNNLSYYYDASEAGNAKLLLNKLKYVIQQKNQEITDDLMKKSIDIFILAAYNLNDQWIKDRFSIKILNNQFNRIINAARGTNNSNKSITERFTDNQQ